MRSRVQFFFKLLGAHGLAWALLFPLVLVIRQSTGSYVGIQVLALGQGVLAATISWGLFKWRWWWLVVNGCFFPALLSFPQTESLSWLLLLGLLALMLFNWNSYWEQVPLYLTRPQVVTKVASFLKEQYGGTFSFIDLGCGWGGVLTALAREFPEANFYGVETAPLNFIVGKIRSLFYSNLKIRFQSFWKTDLKHFDIIYAFLSPAPMPELGQKFIQEAKPGGALMSYQFAIPEWSEDERIQVGERENDVLRLWFKPS